MLCKSRGVRGKSGYLFKKYGKHKTGITPSHALSNLCTALSSPNVGVIYHLRNHYDVPIGFHCTPEKPCSAYKGLDESEFPPCISKGTWIFIGDPSRGTQPIRSLRWSFIVKDLTSSPPYFYDARHPEKGQLEFKKSEVPPQDTGKEIPKEDTDKEDTKSEDHESEPSCFDELSEDEDSEKKPKKKKPRNIHCLLYFTSDESLSFSEGI
eukprot:gnl/Carplike_NY0171/959_a1317_1986.p1 GENE.gnl/Carplike_NY0171/959_a1317_1986~~gnl/Carplike_NY0171/959_a1317_1986.p1  ORF type:complete len:209 (+),score=37.18 gnl/Carplike_NY0171/959_a1317_1986:22-648(+)